MTPARLFDAHGAEFLLIIAILFTLAGCAMQPAQTYETRVSVPVTGEVVFH